MKKAIFAAGCFWGVQFYFDQIPGVIKTVVGYTGGSVENPTYEMVCSHKTGHAEALLLEFDDKVIDYEALLRQFYRMHDPTQLNRQGPDIGDSYRSAIFYLDKDQKEVAERVTDTVRSDYKDEIVTQIVPATTFYQAEGYHQKYAERTGRGMCHIEYKPI